MLSGMINRLFAMGFTARAAIADSWGAAHGIARFSAKSTLVVPEGEAAQAVLDLPIAALRLENRTVAALRTLGFDRVSELAATPRAPPALRFGPEIGRRLDQALGRGQSRSIRSGPRKRSKRGGPSLNRSRLPRLWPATSGCWRCACADCLKNRGVVWQLTVRLGPLL